MHHVSIDSLLPVNPDSYLNDIKEKHGFEATFPGLDVSNEKNWVLLYLGQEAYVYSENKKKIPKTMNLYYEVSDTYLEIFPYFKSPAERTVRLDVTQGKDTIWVNVYDDPQEAYREMDMKRKKWMETES